MGFLVNGVMAWVGLTVLATGSMAQTQSTNAADSSSATVSAASDSVNRTGRPQSWQTAPDDALPDDFAVGGTITVAWAIEPYSLAPFADRDFYAPRIHPEVLEPLTWLDLDSLEPVPGLAQSWELQDDGLRLTFHVFHQARFSDGSPVTADDVVFSYQRAVDPLTRSSRKGALLRDIVTECRAIDEFTVEFDLQRSYFKSVEICGSLWVLPKSIYGQIPPGEQRTQNDDVCVGSGPWILDHWKRGREIVLRRNENYWGPKPALEFQRIVFIPGEQARWQSFVAGRIDLVGLSTAQWRAHQNGDWVQEHAEPRIWTSPFAGYAMIGFNNRHPILKDRRVRRALTM